MASSAGEQQYTAEGVQQNLRADGRSCTDFRPSSLEAGVIEQASGSARFLVGATDVLVAVKAELGQPLESAPTRGQLNVQVEFSACASPEFKGRGSDEIGAELAATLARSVAPTPSGKGALDYGALCIQPGKKCWVLHVDGLVLNDDGGVLDALSMGMRAALANTDLPAVKVLQESEDAEVELEVNDEEAFGLDLSNFPITLTVSKFGQHYALDTCRAEELCADAALQVTVNSKGNVMGVAKVGREAIDPGSMMEMIELACTSAPDIIHNHNSLLLQEEGDAMDEEEG